MSTANQKLDDLRRSVADHLCAIEDECKRRGLTALTRFTLIARDPANDDMSIFVSNEPASDVPPLIDVACKLAGLPVRGTSLTTDPEVERLRAAIRAHRDEKGDDRCWVDDILLYAALGEGVEHEDRLPPKPEFLKSCERFWHQRQSHLGAACGMGKTIAQLEAENTELKAKLATERA